MNFHQVFRCLGTLLVVLVVVTIIFVVVEYSQHFSQKEGKRCATTLLRAYQTYPRCVPGAMQCAIYITHTATAIMYMRVHVRAICIYAHVRYAPLKCAIPHTAMLHTCRTHNSLGGCILTHNFQCAHQCHDGQMHVIDAQLGIIVVSLLRYLHSARSEHHLKQKLGCLLLQ